MLLQITWDGGATPTIKMFETVLDYYEIVVEDLPTGVACAITVEGLAADDRRIYVGDLSDVIFPESEELDLAVNLTAADSGAHQGKGSQVVGVARPTSDIPAGMIVDLHIGVADTDDTELEYELSSSGDGSFDHPSGTVALTDGLGTLVVRYTTPTEVGTAEVSVSVADSTDLSATFTFTLSIVEPPDDTRDGAGRVSPNFPPTVRGVSAALAEDSAEIELRARVEDDGPLAGITYRWDIDGQVYDTGNPITHPRDAGVLSIALTVTDRGAAATTIVFDVDTAAVLTGDVPVANFPAQITGALLSQQDVSYGDSVTLRVYATDPDHDDLGAEWQVDRGTLSSTVISADGESYVFEAVWEADVDAGVAHVPVTISDPDLATAAYVFSIRQVLGRVGITADAGEDQEAFLDGSALLEGGGSESEDGVITRYLWEPVSGPASTIVAPEEETTAVQLTTVGTYVYRLTVGNVNNEDSDLIEILVIDPTQFTYADADVTAAGMIYFLDTTTDRIRRYDAVAREFLPSFGAGAGLRAFAVAPEGDAVYVGYDGGRMDVIDTATGERTFFAAAPTGVLRMAVVAQYVFTIDTSGAWETHSLYSRTTGARTFADDWRNSSNGVAYAPSITRIFTFRDGTSPNDIIRTDVDLAAGTLGPDIDSPYHGNYTMRHPMRLFPDETRIAVASGVFFDTSDLTYAGSIGMGYVDLRFLGTRAYIVNGIGNRTELTVMDMNFNILNAQYFEGEPLNLFTADGSLMLVTQPEPGYVSVQAVAFED